MVIDRIRDRILGLGNAADAIEILSIGYILAVYEDHEGPLSRFQQSTYSTLRQPQEASALISYLYVLHPVRCAGSSDLCRHVHGRTDLRHSQRPGRPSQESAVLTVHQWLLCARLIGFAQYLRAHHLPHVCWHWYASFSPSPRLVRSN